jgi:hypothetical protein
MHWVVKAFDATIGINWDSIEAAIELTVRLEEQRK